MAKCKVFVCLMLVVLIFVRSESIPLERKKLTKALQELFEKSKEVLKGEFAEKEAVGSPSDSKRVSPGGPDPYNHDNNHF